MGSSNLEGRAPYEARELLWRRRRPASSWALQDRDRRPVESGNFLLADSFRCYLSWATSTRRARGTGRPHRGAGCFQATTSLSLGLHFALLGAGMRKRPFCRWDPRGRGPSVVYRRQRLIDRVHALRREHAAEGPRQRYSCRNFERLVSISDLLVWAAGSPLSHRSNLLRMTVPSSLNLSHRRPSSSRPSVTPSSQAPPDSAIRRVVRHGADQHSPPGSRRLAARIAGRRVPTTAAPSARDERRHGGSPFERGHLPPARAPCPNTRLSETRVRASREPPPRPRVSTSRPLIVRELLAARRATTAASALRAKASGSAINPPVDSSALGLSNAATLTRTVLIQRAAASMRNHPLAMATEEARLDEVARASPRRARAGFRRQRSWTPRGLRHERVQGGRCNFRKAPNARPAGAAPNLEPQHFDQLGYIARGAGAREKPTACTTSRVRARRTSSRARGQVPCC
jgi:hypothetical protein